MRIFLFLAFSMVFVQTYPATAQLFTIIGPDGNTHTSRTETTNDGRTLILLSPPVPPEQARPERVQERAHVPRREPRQRRQVTALQSAKRPLPRPESFLHEQNRRKIAEIEALLFNFVASEEVENEPPG